MHSLKTPPTRLVSRFAPETHEIFTKLEWELMWFVERLSFVSSIHAELVRVTRGQRFLIRNLGMWTMLLSERDAIVIDLASWVRAFYAAGGFLRKLHGPDLRALGRKWEGRAYESRDNAFKRLFPCAGSRGVPCLRDVDVLVARTAEEFGPLLADRDEHRAHKYESIATAGMLSPPEVAAYLQGLRALLVDLRSLSSNDGFGSPAFRADPEDTQAQDVVDQILIGTIGWIVTFGAVGLSAPSPSEEPRHYYYWNWRRDHYEQLHQAHGERGSREDDPFNANEQGG